MTIVINLPPAEEARLLNAATESGLEPEELIRKLVSEYLPAADPIDEMRRRIRQWQSDDHSPAPPLSASPSGLRPIAALFRKWEDEDALKSDEEIAADEQLWKDYQQGIDDERKRAGMRTLFGS